MKVKSSFGIEAKRYRLQEEMSTPFLQTTTSIAESKKNDNGQASVQNVSGNGKPSSNKESQEKEDKERSKNINGKEEKIQNVVYETKDLQTDSVEHLGEKPIYQTMDIQTDENKAESKR